MHDEEFKTFVAAYPASRRLANAKARQAFIKARRTVSFETLMSALAQQTRSEQWHKHIIPSLVTWLEEGRWIQTLPEKRKGVHARLTPFEQARRAGLK